MRKTQTSMEKSERNGLRIVAAIALTGSLAAFGCSTNRMPGNGEPARSAPAAGSVAPNATSTPGSSSGTVGSNETTPVTMISSAPASGFSASEDAVAVLKADEGFRGKNLGIASPGDNSIPSQSMQQVTGQFVSPSLTANPQITVNSSISSAPTPVEGVTGVPVGGVAVVGTTVTTPAATVAQTSAASTVAASPIANNGATGLSTVAATPVLGTTSTTNASATSATNAGGSTLGVTNVRAATKSANPTVSSSTTRNVTSSVKATGTTTTTGNASAGVRVQTLPNGGAVITNESPSMFQRFLSAIGLRRAPVAAGTGTTPATTTTP